MSDNPLVSVIIPAYNAQKYIKSAIESVLEQSYQPVECIVVDDGSTDDTAAIVKSYSGKVIYIYQDNAERSVARNNGVNHASGELISFLDADDFIHKDKIEKQAILLSNQPDYDVIFSKTIGVNESTKTNYPINISMPDNNIVKRLSVSNFITINSYLVKKSHFLRIGGFNQNYSHAEDWELLLRLAITGSRFLFHDEFLAYYRIHETNTISNRLKMFESTYNIANYIRDTYCNELVGFGIDPDGFIARHMANYAKELIFNGFTSEGKLLIKQANKYPLDNRFSYKILAVASSIIGTSLLNRIISLRQYLLNKGDTIVQ